MQCIQRSKITTQEFLSLNCGFGNSSIAALPLKLDMDIKNWC